jgi:hypothetical protein
VSELPEVFIEKLMEHIMHLTVIPKVQVERAIGPILGLFIAELLSTKWSKGVELICEEFPLRKAPKNGILKYQSTNIDWLLYDVKEDQLVFLELKTACTSFDPDQEDTYHRVIRRIKESGALFLVDDLQEIMCRSLERKKYEEVLKSFPKDSPYSNCRNAKVVYIAPSAMIKDARRKLTGSEVEWLSFTDLPGKIFSKFAAEWEIIHRYLVELDNQLPWNGTQDGGNRLNYGDTCGLDDVILLCEEKGDSIVIGFAGGVAKLRASVLEELRNRRAFKWDLAEAGSGVKDTRNWISGRKFLEIVMAKTMTRPIVDHLFH